MIDLAVCSLALLSKTKVSGLANSTQGSLAAFRAEQIPIGCAIGGWIAWALGSTATAIQI